MEPIQNNQESPVTREGYNTMSPSLKAYLQAREELIQKYGVKLPSWET